MWDGLWPWSIVDISITMTNVVSRSQWRAYHWSNLGRKSSEAVRELNESLPRPTIDGEPVLVDRKAVSRHSDVYFTIDVLPVTHLHVQHIRVPRCQKNTNDSLTRPGTGYYWVCMTGFSLFYWQKGGSQLWPFRVTWRCRSCDHSIPHRPFCICFCRVFR